MNLTAGSGIRRRHHVACDVAIVGSGPAGATVAATLAEAGLDVVVVEAGAHFEPEEFVENSFDAMTRLYRQAGALVTRTQPAIPLVQGVAVGGTSVINGAISWRLPKDIWCEWVDADPELASVLEWERVQAALEEVETALGVTPTAPAVAGPNNTLLARGAEALGIEHRPIRRNASGCLGLGRCLQGCPRGRKASMDRTLLPRASAAGARILSETEVVRVRTRRRSAVGVTGRSSRGARVEVDARCGVVLGASALQTPALLSKSGIRQGPVGDNFQAHPGVSVAGQFDDAVRVWTGATQGHEVIGLRHEGLKFEALGFDASIAATRAHGVGLELRDALESLDRWAHWGVCIRASARGRVRPARVGGLRVDYRLSNEDLRSIRRGVSILGGLMFAAGARRISPSVYGWAPAVTDRGAWRDFEMHGPLAATAYTPVITHMFGTCRMGSDPAVSVVRPDFRHHHVDRLWVADSSVFPSNIGVNPQTSICALARICAEEILSAK